MSDAALRAGFIVACFMSDRSPRACRGMEPKHAAALLCKLYHAQLRPTSTPGLIHLRRVPPTSPFWSGNGAADIAPRSQPRSHEPDRLHIAPTNLQVGLFVGEERNEWIITVLYPSFSPSPVATKVGPSSDMPFILPGNFLRPVFSGTDRNGP